MGVSYDNRWNRGIEALREMSWASRWAMLMEGVVLIGMKVDGRGLGGEPCS